MTAKTKKAQKDEPAKVGRPSIYSLELAAEICRRIAEGKSLRAVCKSDDMPTAETVRHWLATMAHPEFSAQYAQAREAQAEHFADEIVEIADTTSDPAKARLQIDARKWHASKLAPKKYGERVELDHTGAVKVERIERTIVDPAKK